jgi:hypothetical protein
MVCPTCSKKKTDPEDTEHIELYGCCLNCDQNDEEYDENDE